MTAKRTVLNQGHPDTTVHTTRIGMGGEFKAYEGSHWLANLGRLGQRAR